MSNGSTFRIVKPQSEAQKVTETTTDTIEVTPDKAKAWKKPPFQRPLSETPKLDKIAKQIEADGGIIPGVLALGVFNGEVYLVDGQHRREAFYRSGCAVGLVDIRQLHFKTMGEMAREYVELNSKIAAMKPDDIMRGLESEYPNLAKIRKRCPIVGYDMIRRSEKAPMIGMSAVLRAWNGSSTETPRSGGSSAVDVAEAITADDADHLIRFLDCAVAAWGREESNWRLWSALNVTICMWLYRRLVLTQHSPKTPRLDDTLFTKCLMSVSAAALYVDWLLGRNLGKRDISPAYMKIKGAFVARIEEETGKRPQLPQPSWSSGGGQKK